MSASPMHRSLKHSTWGKKLLQIRTHAHILKQQHILPFKKLLVMWLFKIFYIIYVAHIVFLVDGNGQRLPVSQRYKRASIHKNSLESQVRRY